MNATKNNKIGRQYRICGLGIDKENRGSKIIHTTWNWKTFVISKTWKLLKTKTDISFWLKLIFLSWYLPFKILSLFIFLLWKWFEANIEMIKNSSSTIVFKHCVCSIIYHIKYFALFLLWCNYHTFVDVESSLLKCFSMGWRERERETVSPENEDCRSLLEHKNEKR